MVRKGIFKKEFCQSVFEKLLTLEKLWGHLRQYFAWKVRKNYFLQKEVVMTYFPHERQDTTFIQMKL